MKRLDFTGENQTCESRTQALRCELPRQSRSCPRRRLHPRPRRASTAPGGPTVMRRVPTTCWNRPSPRPRWGCLLKSGGPLPSNAAAMANVGNKSPAFALFCACLVWFLVSTSLSLVYGLSIQPLGVRGCGTWSAVRRCSGGLCFTLADLYVINNPYTPFNKQNPLSGRKAPCAPTSRLQMNPFPCSISLSAGFCAASRACASSSSLRPDPTVTFCGAGSVGLGRRTFAKELALLISQVKEVLPRYSHRRDMVQVLRIRCRGGGCVKQS